MSKKYNVGDVVQLSQNRKGTIRYMGKIVDMGEAYGIELNVKDNSSTSDGTKNGQKYFDCPPGFGVFIKKSNIVALIKSHAQSSADSSSSTDSTVSPKLSTSSSATSARKKHSLKNGKKVNKYRSKSLTANGASLRTHDRSSTAYSRSQYRSASRSNGTNSKSPGNSKDSKNHKDAKSSGGSSRKLKKSKDSKSKESGYPVNGSHKEKLTYIFAECGPSTKLTRSRSQSSALRNVSGRNGRIGGRVSSQRRIGSELSKQKVDLLKKAIILVSDLSGDAVHDNSKKKDSKKDSKRESKINKNEIDREHQVTPIFIVKEFKKIMPHCLEDKKKEVHKETLKLFKSLVTSPFTRHLMAENHSFMVKHLTIYLSSTTAKSVKAAKKCIELLITEILIEDNSKLVRVLMNELLRYTKTSKRKIIRKYCWMFVMFVLESRYNVNQKDAAKSVKSPRKQLPKPPHMKGNDDEELPNGQLNGLPNGHHEMEVVDGGGSISGVSVGKRDKVEKQRMDLQDTKEDGDDSEHPEQQQSEHTVDTLSNGQEEKKEDPTDSLHSSQDSSQDSSPALTSANSVSMKRVIKKKKKASKKMMDAIANALKQGLSDEDKEVKLQAMKVLNLFSLLEELRADRLTNSKNLIAKMSTSTRKLFDSKYGTAGSPSPGPGTPNDERRRRRTRSGTSESPSKNTPKSAKPPKRNRSKKSPRSQSVTQKKETKSPTRRGPKRKTTKGGKTERGKKRRRSFKLKESEDSLPRRTRSKSRTRNDSRSKTVKKRSKSRSKSQGASSRSPRSPRKVRSKSPKKSKKKTNKKRKTKDTKDKTTETENEENDDVTAGAVPFHGGSRSADSYKVPGATGSNIESTITTSNGSVSNGAVPNGPTHGASDSNYSEGDENETKNEGNKLDEDNENEASDSNSGLTLQQKVNPKKRRKNHGRNAVSFGGGGNELDLSALEMNDDALSEGEEGVEDDDDTEPEPDPIELEEINRLHALNGGMNGDLLKEESDDNSYSSSTETYEDNILTQKDALEEVLPNESQSFDIDIDRYLANSNPEYNWKFDNEEMIFFSQILNTHLLMSRISQIIRDQEEEKEGGAGGRSIDYDCDDLSWIMRLVNHPVDYEDLSLIKDTNEFWPTDVDPEYNKLLREESNVSPEMLGVMSNDEQDGDVPTVVGRPSGPPKHDRHEFIVSTQISYNLMRLLTNEHQSDWIKQFIENSLYEIAIHALCVFHPLSNGNVYHGRVILEVLLNHFPCKFFKYLVEDREIIQPLLKYAIFNNIHHGNLNSFVMDLICFDPESIHSRDDLLFTDRNRMVEDTMMYKQTLLRNVFVKKWKFIPNVMARACSPSVCDDVSTKYSVFFVDLVARCASIESTRCLFQGEEDLIIDSFVNGLLGIESGKKLSFWQRIRCGQSLVEYLDLASRPTIMDPSAAPSPFAFMQPQNAYKENIFYGSFKRCLSRLIQYIPKLCLMIIDSKDSSPYKPMKLTHGPVPKPLGRLKLNALELLTVTIDFHEMQCAVVLKEIPNEFWNKIVDAAFCHKFNNMFLCHFRRLVHLAMIFRRRILKYLCTECRMVDRMIEFYETETKRSELHGYILQMLNDIYCHDSDIKHVSQ